MTQAVTFDSLNDTFGLIDAYITGMIRFVIALMCLAIAMAATSLPNVPWDSLEEIRRLKQTLNDTTTFKSSVSSYSSSKFALPSIFFSEATYCAAANNDEFNFDGNEYVAGFKKTYTITYKSTYGFIGYHPNTNAIVVAYRGTSDVYNWATDLSIVRVAYPYCDTCSVHSGFYKAEQQVIGDVFEQVEKLVNENSGATIMVTGHSLGAALATLTAIDLQDKFQSSAVELYTYGCPRIFNQDGANFASAAIGTHYRRTHYKDMVVHVPPMAAGFVHTSGEVYEDGPISSYPNYPGGPMKSCSGEEDETCADQYNGMSVPDHLLYEGIPLGSSDDSCAYAQNPPF